MDSKEFFFLVKRMREAQQNYFKHRTSIDLSLSKKLEKQVDDEIMYTLKSKKIEKDNEPKLNF